MSQFKLKVSVPATSANLGPGFDCLGIALNLFNTMKLVSNSPFEVVIKGEAADQLPRTRENAVVQAIDRILEYVQAESVPRDFRLILQNDIPVAAGLGSSASAIVGGLMLGNGLVACYEPEKCLSSKDILALATQIEGHPDNVSPAIFGGGSLTWQDATDLRYIRFPVPSSLHFVVATPYFPLLTETSRSVVPVRVERADAVYNIAQASRLMIALCTGNLDLLRGGFGDRLHEPYRRALIPGCPEVQKSAIRGGAIATTLSGAGPSLLAWCDSSESAWSVADEMTLAWREHGIPCRTEVFSTCNRETEVEFVNEKPILVK
jgi:homoserine kinase